jgi:predicted membrane chloride channel (bestrophin family)
MTAINAATMLATKFGYFDAEKYHLQIHPRHSIMLTSLMTFFAVFYNGHVFDRYNRLHHLMTDMSEITIEVASMLMRSIPRKATANKLVRMLLASTFIFYFGITPDQSPDAAGNVSQAEWSMLRGVDLLSTSEMQRLHHHCSDLHTTNGFPSLIILHWSLKLIEREAPPGRFNEFEKKYNFLRKCQAEVLGLLELPMPSEYVQLVDFVTFITLLFLSYEMGLADSYLSLLVFFVAQLVFFGIRELSQALADPFGIDEMDFPVSNWMTSVFNMCISIMHDDWDETVAHEHETQAIPLQKIAWGNTVVDVLVDVHAGAGMQKGFRWKSASVLGGSSTCTVAGGVQYQSLPTDEVPILGQQ